MDRFERRVEGALGDLPGPADDASDRARRAALSALPTGSPARRRVSLLIAAALAAGLAGGGALAAIGGALRDDASRPIEPVPRPADPAFGKVAAPPAGNGVVVLVDGRLWLATRDGLTVEGLPATVAGLSPAAKFVALGLGASLVSMAPDGRKAWSYSTPGGIVGVSWAPNPILIAYVITTREGNELWLVEGDGDNPRLLVRDVRPVTPSWRPDSQAIAFVDGQGRAMVYERATGSIVPAGRPPCAGRSPAPAFEVAFAPSGGVRARLAFITRRGELVVSGPGARGGGCTTAQSVWSLTALAWISSSDLVVATRPAVGITAPNSYLWRYRATAREVEERGNADIGSGAIVLDVAAAQGDRVALIVAGDPRRHPGDLPRAMPPGQLEVWWVRVPPEQGTVPEIHSRTTLLRLDGRAARRAVLYRSASVAWR